VRRTGAKWRPASLAQNSRPNEGLPLFLLFLQEIISESYFFAVGILGFSGVSRQKNSGIAFFCQLTDS